MTMSDTPRTDAIVKSESYSGSIRREEWIYFAVTLERELAESRAREARKDEALVECQDAIQYACECGDTKWKVYIGFKGAQTAIKKALSESHADGEEK